VQPSVKIRAGDIEPTDPEYTSSAMSQIIEQGQPITNQDQRSGQEEARWNMSKQHLANVPSLARHSLPKRTVIQAIWPVPYQGDGSPAVGHRAGGDSSDENGEVHWISMISS
jgi:hypothetical protein